MAAPTILRVKRRLEDNPQDALVLMCKRLKTNADEVSPSLFVFRGTVENQETSHVKSIPNLHKDIKLKSTPNVNDIIDKIRKERKKATVESRYEVVNCHRGLTDTDADQFDLVDLAQRDQKDNEQYAYDLYTAAKQDFDISMLDNLVSIENYETDLIFGSHRDNGRCTPSSDEADDDDDSNDENNWRNDYPDEEDSIDEEDMVRAVERIDIEADLSSDAGEDQIYDEPPQLSNEDVLKYGAAYATYKAKVIGTPGKEDFVHCTTIKFFTCNESLQGYKDDSDEGFYYGEEQDSRQFREQYDSIDEPD
ncbi:hypothetical protein MSG28_001988 [Choristoneura fumiferana]|uniref:Uncharacterized protein n=1 Tax=Choristoneura fumiferana TaxID=7141 RepID=A0ACC0JTF7_CHOFU|nr:hypothetical protein MSG28_001988 [Choristoneura fumiferana]